MGDPSPAPPQRTASAGPTKPPRASPKCSWRCTTLSRGTEPDHAPTLVDCGNGVRLERAPSCAARRRNHARLRSLLPRRRTAHGPRCSCASPTAATSPPPSSTRTPSGSPATAITSSFRMCAAAAAPSGEFYPFRHEGRDGAETIAWLRKHPACNGRIGMYGFSYQGATQLLAAAEQPEGLQVHRPAHDRHDLYHGWFYHHGALRLSSSSRLGHPDAARRRAPPRPARCERQARSRMGQHSFAGWRTFPTPPIQPLPIRNCPAMCATGLPIANQAILGQPRHQHALDRIQIPALHIAGWFDTYLEGSIAGYLALRNRAGSAVRARQSIPDRRSVGPHSLGRPRGDAQPRRRRQSRHR
jgi:hypothetical protein